MATGGAQRPDVGKAGSALVSFVCQKCHQPLKLDHSFANLEQPLYSELTAPLQSCHDEREVIVDLLDRTSQKIEELTVASPPDVNTVSKKHVSSPQLIGSDNGNGFTLLGESVPPQSENIGHALKVQSELFDILSGESEVDHPLCEECTDTLLDMLDQQLKITEDECKDYSEFLEKLSAETDVSEDTEKSLDDQLQQLKAEEEKLFAQLEAIEIERKQIAMVTEREKNRNKQLQAEEKNYYQEYNEYKRQLLEYEEAQRSVDNQLKYAKAQVDKLKKTNVFNATFHIWHSGHFGTINNFRLGRLPSVPVDWNEINAAWGQTVLLLHSLCNKMNLHVEKYKLVPYGNYSFLESLTDKSKELPLYGSGGFRFFWDTKFDQAMVAFLDCLQQFKEEVEKGNTGFCLPYKMDKGRIEDTSTSTSYSIKIQFNSEEQWTKALKFMLTNLKWGLAYVSSQFGSK